MKYTVESTTNLSIEMALGMRHTPLLSGQRQVALSEFEASQSCIVRPYLKNKTKTKNTHRTCVQVETQPPAKASCPPTPLRHINETACHGGRCHHLVIFLNLLGHCVVK